MGQPNDTSQRRGNPEQPSGGRVLLGWSRILHGLQWEGEDGRGGARMGGREGKGREGERVGGKGREGEKEKGEKLTRTPT